MKQTLINITAACISVLFLPCLLSGQNAPVTSATSAGSAIPGQQVTVLITVTGFSNIGSVSLTLDYDFTSIQYVSSTINSSLGAAGVFAGNDNTLTAGTHRVIMGWYTTGSGVTLADNTAIITLVFNYTSGSSALQWFDNGASCAYTDHAGVFLNDIPQATYYINGSLTGIPTHAGEFDASLFEVFPNPLSGKIFYLRTDVGLNGSFTFRLINLKGIPVGKPDVQYINDSGVYLIDTGDVPAGFYFLVINYGERKIIKKILKL